MRISSFLKLTLVLIYVFMIFERCLDWNTENSREARQQLSHPSPYLAIHLPTQPPISLLSHLSFYLATHFPTQPFIFPSQLPVSLFSHLCFYLSTHLHTQPPFSLLSHSPSFLATRLPTQPHISLLSHPYPYTQPPISILSQLCPMAIHILAQPTNSLLSHPSSYVVIHFPTFCFCFFLRRILQKFKENAAPNYVEMACLQNHSTFYIGYRVAHLHYINTFFGSAIKNQDLFSNTPTSQPS